MPAALLSEGFARLLQWVFLTVGVRLLGVGFGVVVQQIGEVMLHGRADDSYSLVRLAGASIVVGALLIARTISM